MKTAHFRVIWIALVCVLVVWIASARATTATVTRWNKTTENGRMIASGSYTWTLVTLEADADSSITSDVIDLTGAARLPGVVVYRLVLAGAVGGGSTSNFELRGYWHGASTATAGANAYITTPASSNTLSLGGFSVAGSATPVFTVGTAAAAEGSLVAPYVTVLGAQQYNPRYVSFRLDEEGNGTYTAGTVTLYWEAYAP